MKTRSLYNQAMMVAAFAKLTIPEAGPTGLLINQLKALDPKEGKGQGFSSAWYMAIQTTGARS